MSWILVGLGNPEKEYEGTRHNIGRDLVAYAALSLPKKVKVLTLAVYMNESGKPIKKVVPTKKAAEHLIVVHDDLDLPLGRIKISFGSSAGGHNGVKSIEKALATKNYIRVRVGISGSTSSGKLKRPAPERITDFVLAKFRAPELLKLKKTRIAVKEALVLLCTEGLSRAMTESNAK